MLSESRKLQILNLVNERSSVTLGELKEILNASESTIRRDITELDREGKLIKVFGGAIAVSETRSYEEKTVQQKSAINMDAKRKIGEYAASLIKPGDYVYVDSGTTTGMICEYLKEKDAVYITNAVAHARSMVLRGLKVFLIGGELKETTEAVVGETAILSLQKYHFSIGFFGTNGISLRSGFTTPDIREAAMKKVAMKCTEEGRRYIVADHDKFGVVSTVSFGEALNAKVITDCKPPEKYKAKLEVLYP